MPLPLKNELIGTNKRFIARNPVRQMQLDLREKNAVPKRINLKVEMAKKVDFINALVKLVEKCANH